MKKILTLAAVMVFAASAAYAADLPYEMGGNGGGGSDDTPADVELSSSAGRDLPYENDGGTDDPDDDLGVSWTNEIGRILSLIGIIR